MSPSKPLAAVLVLSVGLTIPSIQAHAQEIRDTANHFSFGIPNEWEKMTSEQLATINGLFEQKEPNGPGIVWGLLKKGKHPVPSVVVVQFLPGSTTGMSREKVGELLRPNNYDNNHFGSVADSEELPIGKAVASSRRQDQVIVRIRDESQMTEGVVIGLIGSHGIAMFYCTSPVSQFTKDVPAFAFVEGTCEFDSGFGFSPVSFGGLSLVGPATLIGSGVGACVFLGTYVAFVIQRRVRRRRHRTRVASVQSEATLDWLNRMENKSNGE